MKRHNFAIRNTALIPTAYRALGEVWTRRYRHRRYRVRHFLVTPLSRALAYFFRARTSLIPAPTLPAGAGSPARAELLERTFGVDVLRCPRCGGRRHRIATITDPLVARKILAHLGLRSEPPALAPARPPPQMRFA